jgi:GTP pyrophosphokinase
MDLRALYPKDSLVGQALALAEQAHQGVMRDSGEPYINHPIKVAETVKEWGLDEESIAAALLHDTVEDTGTTLKNIEKKFGAEVALLVNGLTKLDDLRYTPERKEAESLRKFVISFTKDLRVVIIKLADRLHNMQTIKALSPERQTKMAWETAEIYAPLAYRLGMQKLSGELEDLALPFTHPEGYQWITETLKDSYETRLIYAERLRPMVTMLLKKQGIQVLAVDARAKRYSSLYKKLLKHDMDATKVYDLVALRVIVKTVEDCYAAFGIIHQTWPPLTGRIKDYIARPKPNGYRSLHTTVFCDNNMITEFQIRTKEMHEEAELGIAAHWAYQQARQNIKTAKNWKGVRKGSELRWVEQLRNWQKSFANHEEFVQALKVDFFKDRIFVLTPQNDILDLPAGSTPIDFAYRIHSAVGDQCVGARVNGKLVPLDHELQSGDMVEISVQKGKKPSEDWLRFVKGSGTKEHIKSALGTKNKNLKQKSGVQLSEIIIQNKDQTGYLKEVTSIFSELKINIIYLTSETDKRGSFSKVTARVPSLSKDKAEKLAVRLKKLPGTNEVMVKNLK